MSRVSPAGILATLLLAPWAVLAATRPPVKAAAPAKVKAQSPAPQKASQTAKSPPSAPQKDGVAFFNGEVLPILEKNCFACHSGDHAMGGLDLTKRDAILKGGASGPAVSMKELEKSLLLAAVNYQGKQMPPSGKLPQKEINALAEWVKMGLPMPSGDEGEVHTGPPQVNEKTKAFWSFNKVRRPTVPAVKNKAWVRNPVDAFILSGLESEGLAPNPPVEKAALLRRAHYDLTGLPPSPDDVRAFLADTSPEAYEKVVDRLLASPQYGEKWGRHWLDLVRFAETNSYERDGTKPNAWKYRDYVIRSFNQDKPFDQFVTEQLAGDELSPRTNDRIIATGYYRLGIWDDEPSDPKQALYDDLDDIVSTTSQVFLGLTVSCARCHDHKLDPIPQKDYYRFLAFFNGVHRFGGPDRGMFGGGDFKFSQRPLVSREEQAKHRREVEAHRAKMRTVAEGIEAIEKKVVDDFVPVEKEEFKTDAARRDIVKKRVPRLLTQAEYDRYVALLDERKSLNENRPKGLESALAVTEQTPPRETFLLGRGSPHAPGEKVEPGFLSVLSPPEPKILPTPHGDTSGRRLALARWVANPENPLTARVMANRIWQYHFGRGIVRSTSNFGLQGDKPTHPELLDWLAAEFISEGWKMKPIHRLLMLSNTYRMSSEGNPKALAKDPENDRYWRFDMRRLQAEEIRDSILSANGTLNLQMGGPGFYPTIPEEVLAGQSRPGEGWGQSPLEQQRRRSVYIFSKRSLMTPIIASFDGPETDFSCPARFSTTQPTQALGMINSEEMNEQAALFAEDVMQKAGNDPADRVRIALWRVMQREPTAQEIGRGVKLMESLKKSEGLDEKGALAAFCLVALNLNEFIYLD